MPTACSYRGKIMPNAWPNNDPCRLSDFVARVAQMFCAPPQPTMNMRIRRCCSRQLLVRSRIRSFSAKRCHTSPVVCGTNLRAVFEAG